MNIIITLAGQSRRFKNAGFLKPKFLLELDGKPIILHVTDMFSRNDNFYFVFNKNQIKDNREILEIIKSNFINYKIIEIEPHERSCFFCYAD